MKLIVLASVALLIMLAGYDYFSKTCIRRWAKLQKYNKDGVISGAEGFYIKQGKTGLLMIHGFPGNPSELKEFGYYMVDRGFTVNCIRLPGFGTTPFDLNGRAWEEWYQAGEAALSELRKECDKIYVLGFSTGGLVALNLAANNKVEGIISLSSFFYPKNKASKLIQIPVLKHIAPMVIHYLPTFSDQAIQTPKKHNANNLAYSWIPVRTGVEIFDFSRAVKASLPRIHSSILIIQSRDDPVVAPESATYIFNHVSSYQKKIVWFDSGGHTITMSDIKEQVFETIFRFVISSY